MIMIVLIILLNLMLGIGSDIDNYAHLGGLFGGFFLGVAIVKHYMVREREKQYRMIALSLFGLYWMMWILLIWVGNPNPNFPFTNCPTL
jgi:hypothetical protein